jgi:DNA-binding transcriptional regulator YhcF (GntR family)
MTSIENVFDQLEEQGIVFKSANNLLHISIDASDYLDIKRLAIETLYTEKQVDKAISWGINSGRKGNVTITDIDNFIQSLKQPKKD